MVKNLKVFMSIFILMNFFCVTYGMVLEKCPICCDGIETNPTAVVSCGHRLCTQCLMRLIDYGIESGVYPQCPVAQCSKPLSLEDMRMCGDDAAKMRFLTYSRYAMESGAKHCPTYSCHYVFINSDVEVRIIECPEWHQQYCCQCLRQHNPVISCQKAKRQAESAEEEQAAASEHASIDWISRNARVCPKCQMPVLKHGGCNRVVCPKCKTVIRWNPEKKK